MRYKKKNEEMTNSTSYDYSYTNLATDTAYSVTEVTSNSEDAKLAHTSNTSGDACFSNNSSTQLALKNPQKTHDLLTLNNFGTSQIEVAILNAKNPFDISENEIITVNGQTGLWSNKKEVDQWKGPISIKEYQINEDSNPEIVRKKAEQQLIYEQEIAIRYLRPPTPPPPGDIIIKQEKGIPTPPAPPLVIRQQPPRPETPPPLIIREAPPKPPQMVGQKVITISGKRLPPPPRKVVIERLAPLPSKPQPVIIERWLPYKEQKRRVIFTKSNEPDPVMPKLKNIIIQWEAPQVTIKKEFKDLGVIKANPQEYIQKYGNQLKNHIELPTFVKEIRPPSGLVLASETSPSPVLELEGDIQALSLVDLDSNGLSEYKYLVKQCNQSNSKLTSTNVNAIISELFTITEKTSDGKISMQNAEVFMIKLNGRLGRKNVDDEIKAFLSKIDTKRNGYLDLDEFKKALILQL